MRIIVSGAAGFVGRSVLAALRDRHDVIATDRQLPAEISGMAGDLADKAFVTELLDEGCDAFIHLATIPGGAAEQDPDLAWRVNVEGLRALTDGLAGQGAPVRFVYASSIAIFGDTMPVLVDDTTPPAPRLLYGAHKAIAETWLATLSRRRTLDALSVRLPGIVARPSDGAGLKSAFMSEVFHAIGRGVPMTLPVSQDATLWLMSAQQAASNLAHAATLTAAMPDTRAVTLPAIRATMGALVSAIGRHTGRRPLIDYAPDDVLEAAFGRLPHLVTPAADALGFAHDGDLHRLVAQAFGDRP